MNARRLMLLAAAALLVVIASIWMASSRQAPTSSTESRLFPTLEDKLDAVQALRVHTSADATAVHLVRRNGTWQVEERKGYPASTAQVAKLLRDLERARLIEEKTSNPERYAALGVADPDGTAAGSVHLEIAGDGEPLQLIVGRRHDSRGTYVRRVGEATSWLVDVALDVPVEPADWLQRQLIDIGADRLQSASIEIAGTRPYTAGKQQRTAENFSIDALPKGRELNSPTAANAIASALVALELDDVRIATELPEDGPFAKAVYRTFDGVVVDIAGWKTGDRYYVRIQPGFDEVAARRFHLPATAPEEESSQREPASTASPLDASIAGTQEEVRALAARCEGWAFAIPAYKFDAIFKPLEQLLKK